VSSPGRRLQITRAVGVTLPVHNEERRLPAALASLESALVKVSDSGLVKRVVVVLDACHDESRAIALSWKCEVEQRREWGVDVVECDSENVGYARKLGCATLLQNFRTVDPAQVWLATTDADSRVPSTWLVAQLDQRRVGADLWVGRVAVNDWSSHSRSTAQTWQREYEGESHPVHGANLAFAAADYLVAGGFRSLRTSEDRALVTDLLSSGAVPHFDSSTRVITSSRRHARAPGGFGAALTVLEALRPSREPATRTHHVVLDTKAAI
jgi:glycosyltransferase involved in cell wall biosynthesis